MTSGHEQHGEHGMAAHHGPQALPASLAAPADVLVRWRTRALTVAVAGALLTLLFVGTHEGRNHILRAYVMGYMTCFNFAGGALCMLMLQYVTGGKWGLILRRPIRSEEHTSELQSLRHLV